MKEVKIKTNENRNLGKLLYELSLIRDFSEFNFERLVCLLRDYFEQESRKCYLITNKMNLLETDVTSSSSEEEIETVVEKIVTKMKSKEIPFTDEEQSAEDKTYEQMKPKEIVEDKPKKTKKSKQALSSVKAEDIVEDKSKKTKRTILLKLNQPKMLSLEKILQN